MADAVTREIERIVFAAVDGGLGQMILVGDVSNGAVVDPGPLAGEATEAIVRTCVAPLQATIADLTRERDEAREHMRTFLFAPSGVAICTCGPRRGSCWYCRRERYSPPPQRPRPVAEPSTWALERACEIELSCSCESSGLLCPSHEQIALALDAAIADLEAEGVTIADEAIALRLTVEAREQIIATLTAVIGGKDAALRPFAEIFAEVSRLGQTHVPCSVSTTEMQAAARALALTPASLRERVAQQETAPSVVETVFDQIDIFKDREWTDADGEALKSRVPLIRAELAKIRQAQWVSYELLDKRVRERVAAERAVIEAALREREAHETYLQAIGKPRENELLAEFGVIKARRVRAVNALAALAARPEAT